MLKNIWKKFIEKQYQYFFIEQKKEYYPPIISNEIMGSEILSLLKDYKVYLSDNKTHLVTKNEASRFNGNTKIDLRYYYADEFDCENYAFSLMGEWSKLYNSYAFGIARGGQDKNQKHMFNIMIDDKKEVWIIEPQENRFIKLSTIKNNPNKYKLYYPIDLILI